MAENKMSDIIKSSMSGIKEFTDVDTIFGKAVTTASGVTVIPVSKVSVGFAGGGLDFSPEKKMLNPQNFGGATGTGVSVTPIAFLTVSPTSEINLIEIGKASQANTLDRVVNLIENSPEIINRLKNSF